ncbi:MAG: c-type cytochrome biogenesis protein CcsB [Methylomonas sp.]|jgi:ABC-type transport system involved in cytochrome c biogenesis permease subunit|uniref:c-type cytochrome biogenesis protein CcsB n=1 Tax=Methylomonas sp. TaxID=418 RepID=UPI0025EC689D|nr:c-type cytochrome biogenesis protein CcsB [Methylomonas sp.]MCK9605526.1 c-type cytochrome biogenesis protein CcsB [Methylomonas sp.]
MPLPFSETAMDNALPHTYQQPAYFQLRTVYDWLWAVAVLTGCGYVFSQYHALMDGYEAGILLVTAPLLIWLGWSWSGIKSFGLCVAAFSLLAISLYGSDLSRGENAFLLKYLFASQSAIMWMSALYVMATATYFGLLLSGREFVGKVAASLTWSATVMGMTGLMVRWRESYLVGADIGHTPVSNLYEVFILFAIITALLYLHYEQHYKTRSLGAFVLLVISAAIGFLLWYTFDRHADGIQPLVPALNSYWMKIHVPANFVGYGAFSLAAMIGLVYVLKSRAQADKPEGLLSARLPDLALLDDLMHKAIALGFAFFTLATILGALWAAEAWGGYWSWDPKETWALIVWLNYAAWLHMRLTKGWSGKPMAWWAIIGFFVTLFAFLGVNMFLSGLHSYGEL